MSTKLDKFFWTQKGHFKAGSGRTLFRGSRSPSRFGESKWYRFSNGRPTGVYRFGIRRRGRESVQDWPRWTTTGKHTQRPWKKRIYNSDRPPAPEQPYGKHILAQGLGEDIGPRLDKSKHCLDLSNLRVDICGNALFMEGWTKSCLKEPRILAQGWYFIMNNSVVYSLEILLKVAR